MKSLDKLISKYGKPIKKFILSTDGRKIDPDEWDEEKIIKGIKGERTLYGFTFSHEGKTIIALLGDDANKPIHIEFDRIMRMEELNGIETSSRFKENILDIAPNGVAVFVDI